MIFRIVQKNLDILGISRKQSANAFYVKVFIGYLVLSDNIILHIKFLFRDEITFEQYTMSLYMTTIAVLSFLCYVCVILKRKEFFENINNLESTIKKFSESQSKRYFFFKLKIKCSFYSFFLNSRY